MANRKFAPGPEPQSRQWKTPEEIDAAIAKLKRRIEEFQQLDVRAAHFQHTGADDAAMSNFRDTIRDVFGSTSPENDECKRIGLYQGPLIMGQGDELWVRGQEQGKQQIIGRLQGLNRRLLEKRNDLEDAAVAKPSIDRLHLHPRIADVAAGLFADGYHMDAVFNASKALLNYVKERSGQHDLDGAPLVRTVFSRKEPILAFNDLSDQTDADEQEGMMHLFEGVVLAIRNPGGHSFPEGTDQRALEYLSLISLLTYRLQEAKRRR